MRSVTGAMLRAALVWLVSLVAAVGIPAQSTMAGLRAAWQELTVAARFAAMRELAAAADAPARIPAILAELRAAAPAFDNDGCLLLELVLRAHPEAMVPVAAIRDELLAVATRPAWTSRQKSAQALAVLFQRPAALAGAEERIARTLVPLLASQRGRVSAAAAACLARFEDAAFGDDPFAARAWFHARFGGAVDLHTARFEEVLVAREVDDGFALPDGRTVARADLVEIAAAARAVAADRRRTFEVVVQTDAARVDRAVATPELGGYRELLGALARASGGGVTLAPDTDRFRPPFAEDPARHRELRAALQRALAERSGERVPGAQLAVALADGTLLEIAHGLADRDARTPMTTDARMLAGSTGKTFFAALALQLAGEARIDLDAPLAKWLGGEPWWRDLPNGEAITLRHLMQHRSGLPRYEFAPAFARALRERPDHRFTPTEEIAFVFDAEPRFRPGEGFEYADTNYVLLGMALEQATGTDCYAAIERRFLRPLALGGTVPSVGRAIPGLTNGYAGEGNPFGGRDAMLDGGRLPFDVGFEGAGGGFATTAGDLARWAQALYCGPLLGERELTAMLDARPAPLGRDARYGLGAIVQPTRLGTAVGHRGFFPGWLSEMRCFRERGIAVAILVNGSADLRVARELPEWATDLAEIAVGR